MKNKNEFTDFIFEEILEKEPQDTLTNALSSLSIKTVYVMREINNKSDLSHEYMIPPSTSKIIFKKAYLFYDISLLQFLKIKDKDSEKPIILAFGGDIKKNALILEKERGIDILLNPISDKLSFDTSSSNLAKENKVIIGFNLNLFREKPYSSIKQARFIISLLIKNRIDMKFCSCARKINDLIDPIITQSILLNFELEKEGTRRMLMKGKD
ncbi:MAG: hypothetical protein WCF78_00010 [archaeon]